MNASAATRGATGVNRRRKGTQAGSNTPPCPAPVNSPLTITSVYCSGGRLPGASGNRGYRRRMCGRFTQEFTWAEVRDFYNLLQPARNLQPRYNISPTTSVEAIVQHGGGRELVPMRWGLVPGWWKKSLKEVPSTFNARAETVAEKPMFRSAFKRTRCIIPASGYYEWQATEEGKQPHYITRADAPVFSIAGLWDEWTEPDTGEPLRSCTMIVTSANDALRSIHDRMPVILDRGDLDAWLSASGGLELLKPAAAEAVRSWPVSKRVNRPGSDNDPTLIEPLAA
jgi:putative SOS response-associated peptidase YedK